MLKYGHFWEFLKFSPDSEADKMVLGSKFSYKSMQNDLSFHWKKIMSIRPFAYVFMQFLSPPVTQGFARRFFKFNSDISLLPYHEGKIKPRQSMFM